MMKHGVHSQNQSIISKKYQNLFKIPQNDKTDPGLKGPSPGIGFVIFCEILNIFWYFLRIIDCFWEYTPCFIINELFPLNSHFVLLRSGFDSLDLPINNFRLIRKEALQSCYRNKEP